MNVSTFEFKTGTLQIQFQVKVWRSYQLHRIELLNAPKNNFKFPLPLQLSKKPPNFLKIQGDSKLDGRLQNSLEHKEYSRSQINSKIFIQTYFLYREQTTHTHVFCLCLDDLFNCLN